MFHGVRVKRYTLQEERPRSGRQLSKMSDKDAGTPRVFLIRHGL